MRESLKIALLCHSTVGGSGILATELGHCLVDLGHEIFVISENRPFRLRKDHPRIHFCESTPVEFPLFKSPDHTLPLATRIAEVCSHNQIDVIHAHYAIPHAAAAWIAKELIGEAGPPVVTTLHGTDIIYLGSMVEYQSLLQHVLEAADKVTCVSDNLKQKALEQFTLKKEIAVIPNFYEPKTIGRSREAIRKSLGIGEEALAIHASNLRSIKRVDLMLEGFKQALAKQKVKLLVLSGADSSRIQPAIERLELQNDVIVLNDVYDVDDYFAAGDFTLYASEYESFCLGILEGMCHGCPSVAFDVGGIPEVVSNGETGILVRFGDVEKLGMAIARLAADHDLRKQMGAAAKRNATALFSSKSIVGQYLSAYREVLSAGFPARGLGH